MPNNSNNNVVSSFGIDMPAAYEQAAQNVIDALAIPVTAPVLFQYCYNLLSSYGKNCVTIDDVFTFIVQCKNLGLNPLLKQIYGFVSRGKLVIVVSIEGWNAIAQRSPAFDGFEFEFGPESVRELVYKKTAFINGRKTDTNVTIKRTVADWVRCIIYRKDRGHPIKITTFFDEAYTGSEPWATMPMHMLQNRAFVNAVRKAFNVSAYSDDDKYFNLEPAEPMAAYAEEISADALPSAEPVPEPLPAPSDALDVPPSILGQVDPSFNADDVTIPELEPVKKRGRKKKTEPVTEPVTEPIPEPIPEPVPVSGAEDLPLPPLPGNESAEPIPEPVEPDTNAEAVVAPPSVSAIAADLAYSLNQAKNSDALQQLGYMIQQMRTLAPADKSYLRTVYTNNLNRLKK